jgi:hypothetical protein
MSYQWLRMRISEEEDRRTREYNTRERLPRALDELKRALNNCVEAYREAFGQESAELYVEDGKIRVVAREEAAQRWQPRATTEVSSVPAVPGFQIDRPGEPPQIIDVGMLPGDKFFYRDREADTYMGLEDLTKKILDRILFPKLKD